MTSAMQSIQHVTAASRLLLIVLFSAVLAACGGGGGPETVELPDTSSGGNSGEFVYTGPAPASDDVQSFKLNVWDNLVAENRCGTCHVQGQQAPEFVRTDDVNLAYSSANPLVNLSSPLESLLVTKVQEGHNCWLTSDQACADIIAGYVANWAGDTIGTEATTIQLIRPPIIEPGSSKNFPLTSNEFDTVLHPLLQTYCSECHSDTAANRISPYFASDDLMVAYQAAQTKIDLDTPENSRLSVRVGSEFHNCWSDCSANGQEMLNAILAVTDAIELTELDATLVNSKALRLYDGILANTGGRHERNVIAKWEFKTGTGTTAFDTSGVNPAMDLTLSGDVEWVGGWGIQIRDGRAQATTTTSRKLYDLMAATGEYSIEAWLIPGNVTQDGPARILSYSGGTDRRNFTVGQTLYNYDFLNRSSQTDINGEPALSTANADERLQAVLQHVVLTYSPTEGRRIYVNGEYTGDMDEQGGGSLSEWDDSFAFVIGNEVSGDRLWQGIVRMAAIHNRVLSDEQITTNFEAGVGEKYLLLFSVSDLIGEEDSYIVYEASQFDSYSYLFANPFFVSLDENATIDGIDIEGIRIGLNGQEVEKGQSYKNLDEQLSSSVYTPAEGQSLSRLGAVVNLSKGPANDEFFLTFARIGSNSRDYIEPPPPPPAAPVDLEPVSDIGLKTFERIHATMSEITTVSMTQPDVVATYEAVKQALPSQADINGFASAQQMAITQLSIEYCNALVNDTTKRAEFFPGFDFNQSVNDAYVTGDRTLVTLPLYERTMNIGVTVQPSEAEVTGELNNLIDRLTTCANTNSCSSDRTEVVVKAICAATIGNAGMLLN